MKILIAEDDPISRLALERLLEGWGHEVISCRDGAEAVRAFMPKDPPQLAVLDWMMPEKDGLEVCRAVRRTPELGSTYIILLTAKGTKENLVEGFRAGADDYVVKPFDREELRVRLSAGIRIVENERLLAQRVKDIETALARLGDLRRMLPLCAHCKKKRDDEAYRTQVESYIGAQDNAPLSHWVCPECARELDREPAEDAAEDVSSREDLYAASSLKRSFHGTLAVLNVSEVVQTVHRTMKTGALHITRHDGTEGNIFFVDGEVRHAKTEDGAGEDAFYALQGWREGDFVFQPQQTAAEASIYRPVMALLVEGMRRLDENLTSYT
jgi:prepilin-type processing-associated H-X9-DG protein